MAVVDELGGVITHLLSVSEITALVGTHIYGVELAEGVPDLMPIAAVVINSVSGGNLSGRYSYLPYGSTLKDIKCYGTTQLEARQVWNACYDALKSMGRINAGGVGLYGTMFVTGPIETKEPEVDWPLCFGTFELFAAEKA